MSSTHAPDHFLPLSQNKLMAMASNVTTDRANTPMSIKSIATETTRLIEHDFEVNSLAWSPDGQYLATTGILTKSVNIWDVEKRQMVRTLMSWVPGHAFSGLAYSPNGQLLAGCQHSKGIKVRVWDPTTGQVVHDADSYGPGSCETLAFSPDGKWLVVGYRGTTVKDLQDLMSVVFFDTETWQVAKEWKIPGLHVERITFRPDGKELAVGGSRFASPFSEGVVQLWDVDTGENVKETVVHAKTSVESLAYSMDGRVVASGTSTGPGRRSLDLKTKQWFQQDNTQAIQLWNVPTGKVATLLSTDLKNETNIQALRYTADGKYLIAGGWDSFLRIWDAASYELLQTIKAPGLVHSVAVRPDSARLAASTGKIVTIWELER